MLDDVEDTEGRDEGRRTRGHGSHVVYGGGVTIVSPTIISENNLEIPKTTLVVAPLAIYVSNKQGPLRSITVFP